MSKYNSINDLPDTLRELLPNEDAQQMYMEAYNKSWDEYDEEKDLGEQSRDSQAHRDGWAAVKREYTHDEEKGIWYRKGEEPEEEEQEESLLG